VYAPPQLQTSAALGDRCIRVRLIKESWRQAVPPLQGLMQEVLRIAPVQTDPGLIAYECPSCGYVTSDLTPSNSPAAGQTSKP
jgi:hypothetical protein